MADSDSARCIYIVDDDEAARDSLRILLETNGFAARDFASVDEFLSHNRHDMACLLLDLHMPGMSGVDLLKYLRTHGDTRPVIAISGAATPRSTRKCERRAQLLCSINLLKRCFYASGFERPF
jgi:FixJ family two-component response regulator